MKTRLLQTHYGEIRPVITDNVITQDNDVNIMFHHVIRVMSLVLRNN